MYPLNRDEARSWSKERIITEIRWREREIDDSERWRRETDKRYERGGYRNVEPNWAQGAYDYEKNLREEIRFLTNLL